MYVKMADSIHTLSNQDDAVEKLMTKDISDHSSGLKGDVDVFNGVNVRPFHLKDLGPEAFCDKLKVSLELWKKEGKRGIWVKIPTEQSELIPVATKLGFDFHHAKKGYAMLTKWIQDTPNTIPNFANHSIGVAGLVVNDSNQLLVIQERYLIALKRPIWKLPGGLADPGENISDTAIREVREETGVDTEFVSLLSFRHMHEFRWGTDDLYFICLLKPLTTNVKIDETEIAACKWINVNEYVADPETTPTNRMIAESYLEYRQSGVSIVPFVYPHFISGKPDCVYYSTKPVTSEKDTAKTLSTAGNKL